MTATPRHSPAHPPKPMPDAGAEHPAPRQARAYEVGRAKPPLATRFRKGQSGNPGGRRGGAAAATSATALLIEEAYRTVTVDDEDGSHTMPAIQAVVRSQVALATRGNGPAQRAVIAMVQAVEHERAVAAAEAAAAEAQKPASLIDAARRIAFLLQLAKREAKAERDAAEAAGQPPSEPTPEDALIEEFCKDK